jgi:hypothetical protein
MDKQEKTKREIIVLCEMLGSCFASAETAQTVVDGAVEKARAACKASWKSLIEANAARAFLSPTDPQAERASIVANSAKISDLEIYSALEAVLRASNDVGRLLAALRGAATRAKRIVKEDCQ